MSQEYYCIEEQYIARCGMSGAETAGIVAMYVVGSEQHFSCKTSLEQTEAHHLGIA